MTSEDDKNPGVYLTWDTDFFGVRIGRIKKEELLPVDCRTVDAWARRETIQCLYFLARADCAQTVSTAESAGFHLTDIRMEFMRELPNPSPCILKGDAFIRPAEPRDLAALSIMGKTLFRQGRFHYDGRFPRERCDQFYVTWIENSINGYADLVWVLDAECQVAGFITCHLNREKLQGSIGLVAVGEMFSGRGYAQRLLQHSTDWFSSQGMQSVSVATQGRNIAAQRVYQKCGFQIQKLQLWYHKWYKS